MGGKDEEEYHDDRWGEEKDDEHEDPEHFHEDSEHPDDGKDGHWMCMCGSTNHSTWRKNETDAWGKDEEKHHDDRWGEEKDDEHEGPDRWGKDDEGSLEPCMCGSVA